MTLAPHGLRASYQSHLPAWSYLTFTQNFYYAARDRVADPIVDVTWSLAVEEQFYIFLSLSVRFLSRRHLSWLSLGLLILAPILRFFASSHLTAFLLPLHRADSLMVGVLLAMAWLSSDGRALLVRHAHACRWALVILLGGAIVLTYRQVNIGDAIGHFWLALLYGAATLVVLLREDSRRKIPLVGGRTIRWFGLRSYGIYLLHKPALVVLPYLASLYVAPAPSTWILAGIAALASFSLAEVSYRLLEMPIVERAHRFRYDRAPPEVPLRQSRNN